MIPSLLLFATAPTGAEILKNVDENMTFQARIADVELVVERDGTRDVKQMKVWARGKQDSYVEFLSPPRDKGVKYLKLDGNLYMYLPTSEKVVKISGHLLRQGMMDSDFSYEDMLESRPLLELYDVTVTGSEVRAGEDCWRLALIAKLDTATYARRALWVAKKTAVVHREERFAKSGALLKVYSADNVIEHHGRRYPTAMYMEDPLRPGGKTTMRLRNLEFDVAVPDSLFSRRNLMRGS